MDDGLLGTKPYSLWSFPSWYRGSGCANGHHPRPTSIQMLVAVIPFSGGEANRGLGATDFLKQNCETRDEVAFSDPSGEIGPDARVSSRKPSYMSTRSKMTD